MVWGHNICTFLRFYPAGWGMSGGGIFRSLRRCLIGFWLVQSMTWGVPRKLWCCLDCMFKVTDLQSEVWSSHYWIRFSFTLKNSFSLWFCPHHGSLSGWYYWGLTGGHKVQPFTKLLPSLLLSFLLCAHRISKVQPDMFPIWILLDVQLQDDSWLFQEVFHSRMMEDAGLLRTFSRNVFEVFSRPADLSLSTGGCCSDLVVLIFA